MNNDEMSGWAQITICQEVDGLLEHGPSLAVTVAALGGGPSLSVCALIDTGATHTCISPRIVKELGLVPFDEGLIITPDTPPDMTCFYKVRLELPNVGFDMNVPVLPNFEPPHDVLIGRTLLNRGRLSVDFETGQSVLFLRPSS
jgi:predicted aspartyl protease